LLQVKLVNATTPLHQQRRNPDGTFYPFDAFYLNYTYSFQFMQQRTDVKVQVSPIYDHAILRLSSYSNSTSAGGFFFQMDNKTGGYSAGLTAKTFNWQGQLLGQKSSSSNYRIIPLVLRFSMRMQNVTDAATGFVLRNPDGSFYRNDSFRIQWEANFTFSDARKDIRINVTGFNPQSLGTVNVTTDRLERNGIFLYNVGNSSAYQPFNITYRFQTFNYYKDSLTLRCLKEPYTVVKYSPYFKEFTYMDYNSIAPSTYQRPFVTLVRYDGNNPGYSKNYAGNTNTGPITAVNDTRERAWVNNFTFAAQGWGVSFHILNASIGSDLTFNRANAVLSYSCLNATQKTPYPSITWSDRVQKYYFLGNVTDFEKYAPKGVLYYNLTESARSASFAGLKGLWLFNTTYLYEPVQYNGYLVFKFFDASGSPDLTANATVVSHNLSPLNVYLLDRVKARFGDDAAVLRAFERDLYPSNYTLTLKQLQHNEDGTVVYLVNQTNLAALGETAFPWFNVTVYSAMSGTSYQFTSQPPYLTGETTTYCPGSYYIPQWLEFLIGPQPTCKEISYLVPNGFSLFLLNNTALPSLPFNNATAYYLTQDFTNLILPVNSTLSGGPVYYVNWYASSPLGPMIDPNIGVSREPGQLTTLYQLLYGENATVYVNTAGGGINLLSEGRMGWEYQFAFLFGPQSGGIARLSAVDNYSTTLTDAALPSSTSSLSSFSPPGYYGAYVTSIPVANNGTMTITLVNSWGAKTVIERIPVYVGAVPPPRVAWNFIILIVVILLGTSALSSLLIRRDARKRRSQGSPQAVL
jgi:hypothetical protein